MKRRWIYRVKKVAIAGLLAVASLMCFGSTAYAIGNPDSTPTVQNYHVWAWRNILETGDMLVMAIENTPYATTPTDYLYSEAYIWRFMDGSTDLAQAVGYAYRDSGYGYNVVGFYFAAADAPTWAGTYTLRLSQSPSVFSSPQSWDYPIPAGRYSSLTATSEVKANIATRIIWIANTFYSYWGLTPTSTLVEQMETATVLSYQGQTFFRGAIYGIQGMAPAAFPLTITNFTLTDRVFGDAYLTALEAQHAGNPIEAGFTAGEALLDVDYNLLGLLIALAIGAGLLFGNWVMAGGSVWRGLLEAVPVLVIGSRMALVGLGELSLIAALCMLYANARLWKMV